MYVSPVALGCWPIAGMTSLDVTEEASRATLEAALASGINFFDTAYCYGQDGESERMVGEATAAHDDVVIATKCGIAWDAQVKRVIDGRPETLRRQVDESLRRLNRDMVELLYLHAPDPHTPLEDSAGALLEIMQAGKARAIGVSNFDLGQLQAFEAVCPISAMQPAYNMLQRQIEIDTLPWCREQRVSVCPYWPLMKGLLAGKLTRDHVFAPGDGRAKYPMFQGDEWQRNMDFVEDLHAIADDIGCTVAQLAIHWAIQQPGITAALCGAKRPQQIRDTARAMAIEFSERHQADIAAALTRRGIPAVCTAV